MNVLLNLFRELLVVRMDMSLVIFWHLWKIHYVANIIDKLEKVIIIDVPFKHKFVIIIPNFLVDIRRNKSFEVVIVNEHIFGFNFFSIVACRFFLFNEFDTFRFLF